MTESNHKRQYKNNWRWCFTDGQGLTSHRTRMTSRSKYMVHSLSTLSYYCWCISCPFSLILHLNLAYCLAGETLFIFHSLLAFCVNGKRKEGQTECPREKWMRTSMCSGRLLVYVSRGDEVISWITFRCQFKKNFRHVCNVIQHLEIRIRTR